MKKILLIGGILVFSLQASWKDLKIEERKAWVERHFGKHEIERLEELRLLEDDWLFEGRQSDSLNVRIVGRWPFGPTFEVTGDTIRDLVFQGSGSGVRILDISNMPNVQELTTIAAPYAGLIQGLFAKDTILVVLQGADGFTIYGTTDPTNPNELSRTFIGQWLNDCFIKDSLLFIAGDDSLVIYNIKNPVSPTFLSGTPVTALGIFVQGNYAYLVYQGYLRIYNISDPTNPIQVGIWSTTVDCQTVWVSDTVSYIGTYNDSLQIINVANVSSPFKITDYPCGDTRGLFMVESPIKFLYLPDHDFLRILDVSDPATPQLVDSIQTPGWAVDVWANRETGTGAYIFVGDNFEGLGVYDSDQPSNIQWLYQYGGADGSMDIVVSSNYAYIANLLGGVKIIDISNPQNPFDIGTFNTYYVTYWAIGLSDTVLFTTSSDYIFRAISVIDPSNPYMIDSVMTYGYGRGSVALSGTLAFISDFAVQAIDIGDPSQLDTFKSYTLPIIGSGDIFAKDSLVYVMNDGLRIISYGDPYNPYEIGSFPTTFEDQSVWIQDTLGYLTVRIDGLRIISVANPSSPYELGGYPLGGLPAGVIAQGPMVYVSHQGLKVFDAFNPSNIQLEGYYSTFSRGQLWLTNNYIYSTAYQGGIYILEYYGPTVNEQPEGTVGNRYLFPTIIRKNQKIDLSNFDFIEVYDCLGRNLVKVYPTVKTCLSFQNYPSGVYWIILGRSKSLKTLRIIVVE